jgi:hypothetical protein
MRLRFSRTSPGRAGHELDDDAADRLETEADERYAVVVPDDDTLVAAFEARYHQSPADFAPLA